MSKKYVGHGFDDVLSPSAVIQQTELTKPPSPFDRELELQARLLVDTYQTTTFGIQLVMKALSIGEKKARRLMVSGELKAVTVGASRMVAAVDLAKFMLGIPM